MRWQHVSHGYRRGTKAAGTPQRSVRYAGETRKGRLIIAPAGFTHTHKGHVPASGDKYIATSWILFRRAEELFAQ